MLPSAGPPRSPLTDILNDPRVNCMSLNISKMPDGRYRTTVMRSGKWIKGFGTTPEAALGNVKEQLR